MQRVSVRVTDSESGGIMQVVFRLRSFPHALIRVFCLFSCSALLLACSDEPEPPPPPPPSVTVVPATDRTVREWDEYTGRLEPVDSVEIRARVDGYLESVHFTDGQIVEVGDLLFVIDPRPYQAIHDVAKAEQARASAALELARNDLKRAEQARDAGGMTTEEFETRSTGVMQAEAEFQATIARVRSAELDLGFTQIRSPIRGRVSSDLVNVGNLISGGASNATLLTTVVSLDPIHCVFTASEQDFLRYSRLARRGDRPSSRETANPVEVSLLDEEGFPHKGTMDFVDNRLDPSTGTIEGRAILPNPDGLLTPGLFVRLRLLGSGEYQAVLIPDQAIGTDQTRKFVFVIDSEGVAAIRYVTPGPIIDGLRVIRSGLEGGEAVVVEGVQRVRAGERVTPDQQELQAWLSRGLMPQPTTTQGEPSPTESETPSEAPAAGDEG